jgi:hypothetical protein
LLVFKPHSQKQQDAVFSEKPIVVAATGIQWGKTRVGAWRMKMACHKYTHKDDNFIVTAPTYKIMSQSTLPAFLEIMDGYGRYSGATDTFTVNNGGTVWFRTGTEPTLGISGGTKPESILSTSGRTSKAAQRLRKRRSR